MSAFPSSRALRAALAAVVLLLAGAAAGGWWARTQTAPATPAPAPADTRQALYWYDPMVPGTRFDKPGKSPFMDMELVPMYADDEDGGGDAASRVRIAPEQAQNLGLRLARVERAQGAETLQLNAVLGFNERELSVVQARTGGFVERVGRLAPGDRVARGALLAELLVPEWAVVQEEALALRRLPQPELADAAVQRMRLAGMPEALIDSVLASGQVRTRVAVVAPSAGLLETLDVRPGMRLMAGAPLARIRGLDSVWVEAALPEAQAGLLRPGQSARIELPALPGQTLKGRVDAVLPALDIASRTLRVRIELPNPQGQLRPGLSARVQVQGPAPEGLLAVPTEAVIRTGQRSLVMLALPEGRYRPVEVQLAGEAGSLSLIRSGLQEGQQVVSSAQFLLDSEANLKGVRPAAAAESPPLHEADAHIDGLEADAVTLRHGPFASLHMPAMTMRFPLARPQLAQGLRVGDAVRVGVRQTDTGLIVERLDKQGDRP
jgi:Cu(I)/Ag(I) efflux system membrane fusion protein